FLEFSNKKIEPENGKYDGYLWNGIVLSSWVASIFGINRYEQLEIRYAIRIDTGLESYLNVALISSILIITIYYVFELKKNLRKVTLHELLNKKIEICDNMNPDVLRVIIFCIIIPYLLQWFLLLFYNFAKLVGNNDLFFLNILLAIGKHLIDKVIFDALFIFI
ncbi:16783_t:CDS:2, partial [Funneliformis mosseae]